MKQSTLGLPIVAKLLRSLFFRFFDLPLSALIALTS
jgi:hypothetical protein